MNRTQALENLDMYLADVQLCDNTWKESQQARARILELIRMAYDEGYKEGGKEENRARYHDVDEALGNIPNGMHPNDEEFLERLIRDTWESAWQHGANSIPARLPENSVLVKDCTDPMWTVRDGQTYTWVSGVRFSQQGWYSSAKEAIDAAIEEVKKLNAK